MKDFLFLKTLVILDSLLSVSYDLVLGLSDFDTAPHASVNNPVLASLQESSGKHPLDTMTTW